jgi:hypothetical protein
MSLPSLQRLVRDALRSCELEGFCFGWCGHLLFPRELTLGRAPGPPGQLILTTYQKHCGELHCPLVIRHHPADKLCRLTRGVVIMLISNAYTGIQY